LKQLKKNNNQLVNLFIKIVLSGVLLSFFYHYIFLGFFFELPWPHNSFLYNPNDRFNDWLNPVKAVSTGEPYHQFLAVPSYFPFAYLLMAPIANFSEHIQLIYYFSIVLIPFALFLKRFLEISHLSNNDKIKIVIALIFCYPVLFALDRGNLDLLSASLIGLFILDLRNNKSSNLTIFYLAIAASLKGFPAIFGFILIYQGKWSQAFLSAIIFIILFVTGIFYFEGGWFYTLKGFFDGQRLYKEIYLLGHASAHYASDPFTVIKLLNYGAVLFKGEVIEINNYLLNPRLLIRLYTILTCLFLLYTIYISLIRSKPFEITVLIVALTSCLFPNVCNDYRLTMLLPPLCIFLAKNDYNNFNKIIVFILGLLFIPKHVFFIYQSSLNIIFNSCLFLILLLLILRPKLIFNFKEHLSNNFNFFR